MFALVGHEWISGISWRVSRGCFIPKSLISFWQFNLMIFLIQKMQNANGNSRSTQCPAADVQWANYSRFAKFQDTTWLYLNIRCQPNRRSRHSSSTCCRASWGIVVTAAADNTVWRKRLRAAHRISDIQVLCRTQTEKRTGDGLFRMLTWREKILYEKTFVL